MTNKLVEYIKAYPKLFRVGGGVNSKVLTKLLKEEIGIQIISCTDFLINPSNQQRIWHILNNNKSSNICSYNKEKKFKSFAKGYTFCAKLGHCQCNNNNFTTIAKNKTPAQKERKRKKTKETISKRTPEEKELIANKYRKSMANRSSRDKEKTRNNIKCKIAIYIERRTKSDVQAISDKLKNVAESRTPEEKELIANKYRKTMSEKSISSKKEIANKRKTTLENRTSEEKENSKKKFQNTMSSKTPDELQLTIDRRKSTIESWSMTDKLAYKEKQRLIATHNKDIVKANNVDKFNREYLTQLNYSNKTYAILQDINLFKELIVDKTAKQIAKELDIATNTVWVHARKYECKDLIDTSTNHCELLISEMLTSLGLKHIRNTFKIISPLELDFYLPEHQIGIEFNGVYYHNPDRYGGKDGWLEYHQCKIDKCKEKDISLLHLWENYGEHFDLIKEAINGRIDNNLIQVYIDLYENKY